MALNTSFFYFIILWKGHTKAPLWTSPVGLEGSGAFRRGRDRDRGRDLGGAFQYSRRLTRPYGREG